MPHDGNNLQRYPEPEGRRRIRWSGRNAFTDEGGEEHKGCSSVCEEGDLNLIRY
jgi:hypothetical protein